MFNIHLGLENEYVFDLRKKTFNFCNVTVSKCNNKIQ